jgi:hypothetical protein
MPGGAFDYPTPPGQRVDPMMFKDPYPAATGAAMWAGTAGAQELLPPVEPGAALVVVEVDRKTATITIAGAPRGKPGALSAEPILCIGLGLLKDGRHVAFEAELVGPAVKEWRPLCARPQVDGPERAWWQVGFARLCAKRELLPAEVEANMRDSHGVRPEHFSEGAAVAILGTGRTCTALALRLEGTTVAEPKVVARGAREFCWSELAVWASLNMLPRRRKP